MKFFQKIDSYMNSDKGRLRIVQARNIVPVLAVIALVAANPAMAQAATGVDEVAKKVNDGFINIFDLGSKIIGGLALVMALWQGFRWITGNPDAMKACIGTGIAGIIVMNLKGVLGLFGFSF